MNTKDFILGACAGLGVGLILGICLMLSVANSYKLIVPPEANSGMYRINTITGKTWTFGSGGWQAMPESNLPWGSAAH
jgi:hypothetical protein